MIKFESEAKFLVFDVESFGLFGAPFAVGWGLVDLNGKELESGKMNTWDKLRNPIKDEWLMGNIPEMIVTHDSLEAILDLFYYQQIRGLRQSYGLYYLAADCPWPVETGFLHRIFARHPNINWSPYPLIDVAMFVGMETHGRLERELPVHNP